ncbi:MAG: type IV pili methyl-accepting chemotaxis transducer N-terminal domain-containing protein [Yoonia sp.]|uniref:type IV pili methyl-accepting chemotaxis transducer N-terminal domain-containing protein n=1 Tax=Yoonia sp. TaxID=2212373 RepID=UPI003EF41ECA
MIALSGLGTTAAAQSAQIAPHETQAGLNIISDSAERIRQSGQLRTLTQQVAAASCAVTSGIDVEEAHDVLEHATAEFDRIIGALRLGDEELGILGPEKDRRTIADIDEVEHEWQAIHGAIENVLANGHDIESAHIIDDHNLRLLDLTTKLAADIAGEYAHPFEISAADAFLIEFAGRQRMLTQKIAKDACEVWTGYHADAAVKDLEATMNIFENSLFALRDGMPAMGIQPAPTEAIRSDLDGLITRWDVISANTAILVAGGELNEEQKSEVFHNLEVELIELDHLLEDYQAYAERNHDL